MIKIFKVVDNQWVIGDTTKIEPCFEITKGKVIDDKNNTGRDQPVG